MPSSVIDGCSCTGLAVSNGGCLVGGACMALDAAGANDDADTVRLRACAVLLLFGSTCGAAAAAAVAAAAMPSSSASRQGSCIPRGGACHTPAKA